MSDAHEQIRNLLGLYCERMDAGDFDGLAELFARGRLADENGNVFCTGAEAMAKMWRGQTMMYDGSPRTRHVTANPIIEVDEEAGVAAAADHHRSLSRHVQTRRRHVALGRTQLRRRPPGKPLAPLEPDAFWLTVS
jgi:hypothetical protein